MGFDAILCLNQSAHDSSLFTRYPRFGCVFLLLYVDDMIIAGNDAPGILYLKRFLNRQFEIKDLGHLWYFLGVEVANSPKGCLLSQTKYCNDVLQ